MRRPSTVCIFCLSRRAALPVRSFQLQRSQQRKLQSTPATGKPAGAAAAAVQEDHDQEDFQERPQPKPCEFDPQDELTEEERTIRDALRKKQSEKRALDARVQKILAEANQPWKAQGLSTSQKMAPKQEPPSRTGNSPLIRKHSVQSRPLPPMEKSQSQTPDPRVANSQPHSGELRLQFSKDSPRKIGALTQDLFVNMRGSGVRRLKPAAAAAETSKDRRNRQDGVADQSKPVAERKRINAIKYVLKATPNGAPEPSEKSIASEWKHVRRANEKWSRTSIQEPEEFDQNEFQETNTEKQTQHQVDRSARYDVRPAPEVQENQFQWRTRVVEKEETSGFRDKKSKDKQSGKSGYRKRDDWETKDDLDDRVINKIERKRQKKLEKQAKKTEEVTLTPVLLPEFISIGNLATALRVRANEFSAKLQELGFEDTNNDYVIDAETAGLIASEFNYEPILPSKSSEEDLVAQPAPDDDTFLLSRPPVITIMGHVDHGKTTLLDWLRKSSVAASEHGGITQHIGAFTVEMPSGRTITFIDTPGHAAFLSMRARGANVTDIVILVVAADDSVKPQTIEAIKHAKDARVPVIVAINKMDKPDANPRRVKEDLARYGIEVEDFGGDTQTVEVSGKTGQGMQELEDAAITLSDVLDVRADTTGPTEGWVLEATQKPGGKVATVLVRRGTLEPGQVIVAGTTWARVRQLRDASGALVHAAAPGTPVEVDGWRDMPEAGAEALQAPDEQKARSVVQLRADRQEQIRLTEDVTARNEARKAVEEEKRAAADAAGSPAPGAAGLAGDQQKGSSSGLIEIPLIIRADVAGSVEALSASLLSLGNTEVRPLVLKAEVGSLTPGDVDLAATVKGHIVAFGVPVEQDQLNSAAREGVKVLEGNVIYRIVDEVKGMLAEKMPEKVLSRVTGEADVLQEFEIGLGGKKRMKVAGCKIRNGVVNKNAKVRVSRGGVVVYDGTFATLKNQKKDVQEMRKGMECGLSFENFDTFLPGDSLQCYETYTEKRTL